MHYPPSQKFPFNLTATSVVLMSGAGVLLGWSLTESTAAAAATVDIYDGPVVASGLLASVTLSTGQSTRDLWAPNGIELRNGLTVNVSAGAALGTLYALPGEVVDAFLLTQGYKPIWRGSE